MLLSIGFPDVVLWILYIIIPIIVFYVIYLLLTKSFSYLGFSTIESTIIILISFLFSFTIILFGYNISNISLFTYNNWKIDINTGGAIIPILISIYLIIKKKISLKTVLIGVIVVTIVTFLVTHPEPAKGIVSPFPYWLLPALFAGLISIIILKKDFAKGAPLAYVSGTFGVLIGADFLHLFELLRYEPTSLGTRATIGGAVLFDLVFLAGVLAVLFYGTIMYRYRR